MQNHQNNENLKPDSMPEMVILLNIATLTVSGVDPCPGSGIAGYQASLNNGAWLTFNGAFVVKNGEHTVAILVVSNHGVMEYK